MKKVKVMVTTATERALLDWAKAHEPAGAPPPIELAASLALDEWAKERQQLIERLNDARRLVDASLA